MVGDLLSKRKTFAQAAMQMSSQLVTQEIENDIKAMTTRLLLGDSTAAQQKATEQGGLLYHLFATQQGTVATQGAALQQAAVVQTSNIQQTTATQTGQTAQTAAVTTGGEARVGATTAAASQGQAAQAAIQSKTVMSDAAQAFSGVYASVSSIPVVGWILAPVAAAAAFAAVAAYESLDVGAWKVPGDMTAKIHQGEMVVPAKHAETMRAGAGPSGTFDNLSEVLGSQSRIANLGLAVRHARGLAEGTWEVPEDLVTQIHAGEMVVPSTQADALRSAVGGAGGDKGTQALIAGIVGGGANAVAATAAASGVVVPPAATAPTAAAGGVGGGGINSIELEDQTGAPTPAQPALGYKPVGEAQGGLVYNVPGSAAKFGEKTLFPPVLGGSLGFFGTLMGGPLMELLFPHLFVGFENWFNKLFGGTRPGEQPIVPTQPGAVTSNWGTVVGPATSQYGEGAAAAAVSPTLPPITGPTDRMTDVMRGDVLSTGKTLLGEGGGFGLLGAGGRGAADSLIAGIESAATGGGAAGATAVPAETPRAMTELIESIRMQAADTQRTALAQQGIIGAGLGPDLARVITHSPVMDLGAWRLPPEVSPVYHRETGAIPAATMLASGGRSTEERGGGGDTIGDTHMTWHYHEGKASPHELMETAKKALRNFHPIALQALRRR